MKRYKHNLSHYHLTSCDLGELIPIANVEVLPGDTIQQATSMLIRVTPQLKPVMHPVRAYIRHFFVPYRILWSGWEDFITGESATAPPQITPVAGHAEGTLYDYLGISQASGVGYNDLHLRAYNMVWNEYFRDADLVSESALDSQTIKKVAWAKDYFTAARPWPQKGDAVTLPVGTKAMIKTDAATAGEVSVLQSSTYKKLDSDGTQVDVSSTVGSAGNALYADLSDVDAIDIREFREAFQLQRYQEARARYGSDYIDYLAYLGINTRTLDARLQRPEYLGGGSANVNFSEVLNTASNGGTDPIGDMGGHGIAALRSNRYRRHFPEHGVVLTVLYVRPKAIYTNGLQRKFFKQTKEDYYQHELENIGQQEIYNKEVRAAHSTPDGVFGYGDRYDEYRRELSYVTSEFKNSTSYDWHFGRIFSTNPALNESFITCDPSKRPFAEQTEDSLWIMCNHKIVARRRVRGKPVGGGQI